MVLQKYAHRRTHAHTTHTHTHKQTNKQRNEKMKAIKQNKHANKQTKHIALILDEVGHYNVLQAHTDDSDDTEIDYIS